LITHFYIKNKKGIKVSCDFLSSQEAYDWVSSRKYIHWALIEMNHLGERIIESTIIKGKKKKKDTFDNVYANEIIQLFAGTDTKFIDVFPETGRLYYRYVETSDEANKLYSYIVKNELYGRDFKIKYIIKERKEICIELLNMKKYGKQRSN